MRVLLELMGTTAWAAAAAAAEARRDVYTSAIAHVRLEGVCSKRRR